MSTPGAWVGGIGCAGLFYLRGAIKKQGRTNEKQAVCLKEKEAQSHQDMVLGFQEALMDVSDEEKEEQALSQFGKQSRYFQSFIKLFHDIQTLPAISNGFSFNTGPS